jgi:hypothetical protein
MSLYGDRVPIGVVMLKRIDALLSAQLESVDMVNCAYE